MPRYRLVVTLTADTREPEDRIVNTFYLNDGLVGSDPQGICNDVLAMWQATWYTNLAGRELRVTAYNVGPPPQYPVAEAVVNDGAAAIASTLNREVAVCLSYYSELNRPRQRGRMYLTLLGSGVAVTGARIVVATRDKALTLAQGIADIGGIDVSWQVWSPTDNQGRDVTNAWVDDAWDVQRRRGLRASTRSELATGA